MHNLIAPGSYLGRRQENTEKPPAGHIAQLDSLRGVAAVFVACYHFRRLWYEASPGHFWVYLNHFPFVMNGKSAVIMFFTLSGFVLALPIIRGSYQNYPTYLIRRVCRIYMPYVVAISVAIIACRKFYGLDMYGQEFRSTWHFPPTLYTVAQHLVFVGKYDVWLYDPPIWSLVHEMRISLVFPILCIVSLRRRASEAFAVALSFPLIAAFLQRPLQNESAFASGMDSVAWLRTLGFCGIFMLGSILARHQEAFRVSLGQMPRVFRWVLLALAIFLYERADRLPAPLALKQFMIGIGSSYIILLALNQGGAFSRILHVKPLRFLGRVSYSLYLAHLPILMILSIAVYRKLSYGYLLLPFLAISLTVATLFNQFVELPSIRLGRRIGRIRVGNNSIEASPQVTPE